MLYVYVLNDFLSPTQVEKIKIFDFEHAPEKYKNYADPAFPAWILVIPEYLWKKYRESFIEVLDNSNLLFYKTTEDSTKKARVVILHSKENNVYLGGRIS